MFPKRNNETVSAQQQEYQPELYYIFNNFITDFEPELEPWLPVDRIILVVGF